MLAHLLILLPVGRFGKAYTAHPLFTADTDNPSIVASTGFPVCIPRSADDVDCPAKNRPNGAKKLYVHYHLRTPN